MPRASRSVSQLTEEQKRTRRREQKKLSMRRARAKMTESAIEEVRKKDRERYHKKKERREIKTINDYTPREQRQIKKMWREKSKKRRELLKLKKQDVVELEGDNPSTSTTSSRSRVSTGKIISARNRRRMKQENESLKKKIIDMRRELNKYKMRVRRLKEKENKKILDKAKSKKKGFKNDEIRKAVHDFLTEDENSRLTSGKNETITRRKSKRQIRLLNDTLLNLHKTFVKKTGIKISYQTFRRHRPFWVLFPKASSRNTCLCVTHENSDLIVRALQKAKVICHGSASNVAKTLCCPGSFNLQCLERKCTQCKNKKIDFNNYNDTDIITYERWVTKNVNTVIKGKEKLCKKTIKETVKTTNKSMVQLLHANMPIYMRHVGNFIHQIRAIQSIKENLTIYQGLLHVDFSENYNCKYSAEIQSAHFGGSKSQLSLHTCVYYSTENNPPDNYLKTTSICTVSENLRHDPALICTHLNPVFKRIKEITPDITELHVLSDGPSTQYRNKSMFYLISNYIGKELGVEKVIWHYSEKGHGKGAPDGVGGCIKRLCDNSVGMGKDISSYEDLMGCLKENCKGIEIYGIDDSDVTKIQSILDKSLTKPFKGTFNLH
jgi:hypothetical protein